MSNYIKKLKELNKDSLLEAGGKGANLGILINAGLPVPPGFVVTTSAYDAHLERSGLKERITKRLEKIKGQDINEILEASKDISSWIEEAQMPIEIQKELNIAFDSLYKKMGVGEKMSVSVRSSATAEDLPTASFAGQHETYLGIYGKENVIKHVKKCWASLWSSQAINYRISMNFEHLKVDLAVVVQAMIDSEAAGVMFTANPVNGKRDEILISAGYGLGEAVVSGLITPDSFVLSKKGDIKEKNLGSKEINIKLTKRGIVTEKVPDSKRKSYCLESNELKQLTKLAELVEKHYGSPQDTEWALSEGKIYLLQARPITTMEAESEDFNILGSEDKIIYQGKKADFGLQSVMEHSPYPHTPLDFACFTHFYQGIYTSFSETGFKMPKEKNIPIERESGCVALSYQAPSISPAIIWKGPKSLINSLFKDTNILWQDFSREANEWIKRMDTAKKNTNDAEKLIKFIKQGMKEYENFVYKRFSLIGMPSGITEYKFNKLIKKAVGKEKFEEVKENLLRALPFRTALQNKEMIKIAQTAAINGKGSQAFEDAIDNLLKEYGDRPSIGAGRMISPSTWSEKPEMINEIIDALLCDTSILDSEESFKKQEEAYKVAKDLVKKGLKCDDYKKFTKVLEKIRNMVIIREESVFYLEKIAGCLHRMALKLGSLLVKKDYINDAEDVFFIFLEELNSVAEGKLNIEEKLNKRKKAFDKVYEAHEKGVHWLVATGSIPVFELKEKIKQDKNDASNSIKGSAASRGVYEGQVCIVRNPSEFKKLKKGDILVSPYTSPIWTPLFKVASAAVTEIGSPTSHAAIVAREYGIPAVVAIDNATSILKDGQRIRVDGTNGVITLL
ncbi:PEP/pyruvate-binding domain-containing protein [Clostridium beijerinckii]|uniref:PEP/pyruvate-binding domain-containing protein n=1 Tax=Clostridium beijerinckii TaxID=1520 RepID=UPI0003D36BFF|nr:PEP/pyruvate-binding domain-containing protein [Clostridium beijerinckii]ALB44970.1 pyruvate, phosphate dikinase [Clostridium beijerinckii NRRL B-598]